MSGKGNSNWKRDAVVAIGLILTYFKTAEAMVGFAPRGVFGMTSEWVSFLWSYVAAALVEGVILMSYQNLTDRLKDRETKRASWYTGGFAVAFSITMNIIDQKITDGTWRVALDSPLAQVLYTVIMLIPFITALTMGLLAIIDSQHEDIRGGGGGGRNQGGFGRPPERERGPEFAREHLVPPSVKEVAGGQSGFSQLPEPSGNGKHQFTSELVLGPRLIE